MSLASIIILGLICSCGFCSNLSDVDLNTAEMIENHGYICENHEIVTQDGYILNYQRIPHGLTNTGHVKKPVILLMHGLGSSSTQYVDMGPKNGLAYILSDLGYDVWLGNARGTPWSRRHKTLNILTDEEKFFDFSWHEIGYYDLPAAIDHILSVTQEDGLYYVGHSQGGTVFLVLAATRPEYNKKIKLACLVAPASFMDHNDNKVSRALSEHTYELEALSKMYKIYQIPFLSDLVRFHNAVCARREIPFVCVLSYHVFGGNLLTPEMKERFPVLLSHFPTNGAFKQVLHYGQLVLNGGFRQYDYGVMKNRQIYGQETPPDYNLGKISAPVAVLYSEGDPLLNYKDVQMMIGHLPNVVYEYLAPPSLGHLELLLVKDLIDPVDGKLIEILRKYRISWNNI